MSPSTPSSMRGWVALVALLLASTASHAQEEPQATGALELPGDLGSFQLGGRFSVREALDAPSGAAWAGELSIQSARLEVTYNWKKRLRTVVEFDVLEGLKDAYAKLNLSGGFALRAGQFKVPLSLVELESTSRLPLVRRGLLRDVLDDALLLTGRRPGVQLEWKYEAHEQAVKLRAGVWQTRSPDDEVALQKGLGLIPMLRGTWETEAVEVGVSALLQPPGALEGGTRTGWTASLDVKHTLPVGEGALRTWAEVLVGRTELLLDAEEPFLTARLLTAWRIGGGKKGGLYVEPFVMLSAFDPRLQVSNDLLGEGAGGVNVGQRGRWRMQAQLEVRQADTDVPPALRALKKNLVTRKALLLQMEVGF